MTPTFLMSEERTAVTSVVKNNLYHLINIPFLSLYSSGLVWCREKL